MVTSYINLHRRKQGIWGLHGLLSPAFVKDSLAMDAAENPEYSDSSLDSLVVIDPAADLMLLKRISDNEMDSRVVLAGVPGGVWNGFSVSVMLVTLEAKDF